MAFERSNIRGIRRQKSMAVIEGLEFIDLEPERTPVISKGGAVKNHLTADVVAMKKIQSTTRIVREVMLSELVAPGKIPEEELLELARFVAYGLHYSVDIATYATTMARNSKGVFSEVNKDAIIRRLSHGTRKIWAEEDAQDRLFPTRDKEKAWVPMIPTITYSLYNWMVGTIEHLPCEMLPHLIPTKERPKKIPLGISSY